MAAAVNQWGKATAPCHRGTALPPPLQRLARLSAVLLSLRSPTFLFFKSQKSKESLVLSVLHLLLFIACMCFDSIPFTCVKNWLVGWLLIPLVSHWKISTLGCESCLIILYITILMTFLTFDQKVLITIGQNCHHSLNIRDLRRINPVDDYDLWMFHLVSPAAPIFPSSFSKLHHQVRVWSIKYHQQPAVQVPSTF